MVLSEVACVPLGAADPDVKSPSSPKHACCVEPLAHSRQMPSQQQAQRVRKVDVRAALSGQVADNSTCGLLRPTVMERTRFRVKGHVESRLYHSRVFVPTPILVALLALTSKRKIHPSLGS